MANRKLPFGYETRRGRVCIKNQEAGLVQAVFRTYAEGTSYQELTRRLNAQEVPYSEPGKPWNKNMVARVLNCEVYTGTELYPAILSEEDRHRALAAKPSTGATLNTTSKTIRQLARCAGCGSPLVLSGNRHGWARWNCPDCGALTPEATTPVLIDELTNVLSKLIRDPGAVQTPPLDQADFRSMENDFSQFLQSTEFDESTAKAKALTLAAAQLDALGSEDYETMQIKHRLAQTEQNSELDAELLRRITSSILIHPAGAVSLRLKNGQIMERG